MKLSDIFGSGVVEPKWSRTMMEDMSSLTGKVGALTSTIVYLGKSHNSKKNDHLIEECVKEIEATGKEMVQVALKASVEMYQKEEVPSSFGTIPPLSEGS